MGKTRLTYCLLPLLLLAGCGNSHKFPLAKYRLLQSEPETQKYLDDVPTAQYKAKTVDSEGNKGVMNFAFPLNLAPGDVGNETRAYDTAPTGQVNYSAIFGNAFDDYISNSLSRAKGVVTCVRDIVNWNLMKQIIMEVGKSDSAISNLTLEQRKEAWGRVECPDLYISASLADVTVSEKSNSAGLVIAGWGGSRKTVQTTIKGFLEIHDPYTGVQLVSVGALNTVTAYQIGAQVFRLTSMFGSEEFLNAEATVAEDMSKSRVQTELADFLVALALNKLYEAHPEYLTARINYRTGLIQAKAEELALERGLTVVGKAVPVIAADLLEVDNDGVRIKPISAGVDEIETTIIPSLLKTPTPEDVINPQDGRIRM